MTMTTLYTKEQRYWATLTPLSLILFFLFLGAYVPAYAQQVNLLAFKFHDADCDGLWDADEDGLGGWVLYVDENGNGARDGSEPFGTTDATGFTQLSAAVGQVIAEEHQDGWAQTFPGSPGTHTVDEQTGDVVFGNIEAGTIQGTVYEDLSADGQQDAGDGGAAGRTVELTGTTCTGEDVFRTVMTETDGSYAFEGLLPGSYQVTYVLEAPWQVSTAQAQSFSLQSNQARTVNFGTFRDAQIHGRVFEDQNGNGLFEPDEGEKGIAGRTIRVTGPDGERMATTDADGSYRLSGLKPGSYEVEEIVPPASAPTTESKRDVPLVSGDEREENFGHRLLDFGDAPASYVTLLADGGPRHMIAAGVFLGKSVDDEGDGQPEAEALGDDDDGNDDDDGVAFLTSLIPAETARIEVQASAPGILRGWIDYNGNDRFEEAENIFGPGGFRAVGVLNAPGPDVFDFLVPAEATALKMARFRYTTMSQLVLGPTDLGLDASGDRVLPDGEVEDYALLDFGDAPDTVADPRYPTLRANDGARHFIEGPFLGKPHDPLNPLTPAQRDAPDAELDGRPDTLALGDDGSAFLSPAFDDEGGVTFEAPVFNGVAPGAPLLLRGKAVSVIVEASEKGILNAWIDWNRDGDWEDLGERLFANKAVEAGPNELTIDVPDTAPPGVLASPVTTYARFRLTSGPGKGGFEPFGLAEDGEVEDYLVHWVDADFGDAPFGTLAPNGAVHAIDPGFHLGYGVDAEANGQPSPTARADAFDDGVSFLTAWIVGEQATVIVRASKPGVLNIFLDETAMGGYVGISGVNQTLAQPAATDIPLAAGFNEITFQVPGVMLPGGVTRPTTARFRLTAPGEGGGGAIGASGSGEVEDYRVFLIAPGEGGASVAASLSGQKFHDHNGNGVHDPGEPGIDGWTIQLLGEQGDVLLETTTMSVDANADGLIDAQTEQGVYAFPGLDPGENGAPYRVREVAQEGWIQTQPGLPEAQYTVILQRGEDLSGLDFGNARLGAIHGVVFEDVNANGVREEGEPGLSDWVVYLDLNANGVLDEGEPSAHTREDNRDTPEVDEEGGYWLVGLMEGDYLLASTVAEGWKQTVPNGEGTHAVKVVAGERLEGIDFGFQQTANPVAIEDAEVPISFRLHANYPNPFNPTTTMGFDVQEPAQVVLKVYDLLGREVATLVDALHAPGRYEVRFDARGLPSGTYLYQIQMGGFSSIRSMVLMK